MNDEARTQLDEILSKEPAALTEEEQAFLAARRSYLTEDQRQVYGVSEPAELTPPAEEEAEDSAPPTGRSRRKSS